MSFECWPVGREEVAGLKYVGAGQEGQRGKVGGLTWSWWIAVGQEKVGEV